MQIIPVIQEKLYYLLQTYHSRKISLRFQRFSSRSLRNIWFVQRGLMRCFDIFISIKCSWWEKKIGLSDLKLDWDSCLSIKGNFNSKGKSLFMKSETKKIFRGKERVDSNLKKICSWKKFKEEYFDHALSKYCTRTQRYSALS